MEIRYEWRVLSDDGLLKEPRETRDGHSVNYFSDGSYKNYDNYKTEDEAYTAMKRWIEKEGQGQWYTSWYTLVKLVR